MARMLGRYQTPGCCPGAREGWKRTRRIDPGDCYIPDGSTRWRKRVEQREMARELRPEGLLPAAEPDDGDCLHGCNGGCVYGGSERCNFTCHDLTPREEDVFERLDRRDAAAWAWKRPRSLRRAGAYLASLVTRTGAPPASRERSRRTGGGGRAPAAAR